LEEYQDVKTKQILLKAKVKYHVDHRLLDLKGKEFEIALKIQ